MSTVAWTLTRVASGESKTLEGWGIRSALRSLVNQGRDTLTLGFAANDLLGNSPFDTREILRLDRVVTGIVELDTVETPTTVFKGHIIAELRGAYGSSEGFSVILAGPWWYLENLVYTQPANFATDVSAPTVADAATGYPLESKDTSQILFSEDQLRSRVDSRFMIIEALNFAIAKGAPLQFGTIDPGISIPRESMSDITCAEIVLRCLRWTPGQSLWIDYETDPPTLNIMDRENRTLQEIDLEDEEIAQVELNPRLDLIITGVTINYMRRHQRFIKAPVDPLLPDGAYTLTPLEVATLEVEQAGPNPVGIGALMLTLELFGSTLYQTAVTPLTFETVEQEATPEGIAASLYASYSALQFEGRISLVRDECEALPWIGRKVQMLNGNHAWNDRIMDIRQADDDLFSGRTELSIGPGNQLGPGDLLGLLRKGKTIPPLRGDLIIRDFPTPVPTIPPTPIDPPISPPTSPPHDPPPDTDPHYDLDPSAYIVGNVSHSGSYNKTGSTGVSPPGPGFTYAPLGGPPPYNIIGVGGSGIGASIGQSSQVFYTVHLPHPPNFDWSVNLTADGSYTVTTFDFGQFSVGNPPGVAHGNIKSLWLFGTQTKSSGDAGPNITTPISIEISAGVGGRFTFTPSAVMGAIYQRNNGVADAASASGSVTFGTLRVFTRPPPPP